MLSTLSLAAASAAANLDASMRAPFIDHQAAFVDRPMSLDGVRPMNGASPMQLWLRGGSDASRTVLDAVRARTADEADAFGAAALILSTAQSLDQQDEDRRHLRLRGGAASKPQQQQRQAIAQLRRRASKRFGRQDETEKFILDPLTLTLVREEHGIDGDAALRVERST